MQFTALHKNVHFHMKWYYQKSITITLINATPCNLLAKKFIAIINFNIKHLKSPT